MPVNARSLAELADLVGGRLQGPPDLIIHGIASLDGADKGQISFVVDKKYHEKAQTTGASALILPLDWPYDIDRPAIQVKDPYLAYALIANMFAAEDFDAKGIHPTAVVGQGCQIHEQVTIGPRVVLGDEVKIGPRVTLCPGVVLGDRVEVLEGTILFPNVVVYSDCIIGRRVRIHAGAVIGADGFGYAQSPQGMVKIPQLGRVFIEDDVEIGANTTIDRAAFGETRIGQGTKIDNLVMIAHNVEIGPGCALVAQVGISGSTRVGCGVMMGGQVGVVGHLTIGDGVQIGAKSGVMRSIEPNERVSGIPTLPHQKWLRVTGLIRKLPELFKQVKQISKRLERLEKDG